MRVLLVNPPPYRIVEPYYDTPPYPRTGIAYLAGYLRSKGVDVHVLDCKFDRLSMEQGMDEVRRLEPDVVGLGAFTNEIIPAADFAKAVKAWRPRTVTVIGSVHVSAIPEGTLREFPQFDYGVVGEGEQTFHEFLQNLGDAAALAKTRGVCFLDKNGGFVFAGDRPRILDQDSLPFPAWDLFKPAREYILHTERGCPFACNFCMNPNGRIVRSRTPENVLEEVAWLSKIREPKRILFGDEIFTIDRDRAARILELLIAGGYHKKLSWWCQTHVRTIDLELVQLMRRSNCDIVGLGIESGDDERLKTMGKGTSRALILKAVAIMKEVGQPFMSFFILGQPDETWQSAMRTIDFAVELNPTLPILGLMVPYPGTRVAEMAKRGEGGYVLRSTDWNEYNKQFGDALEFKNLTRQQLELLQVIGYLKVFLYNLRFIDLARFLWRYRTEGFALVAKAVRRAVGGQTAGGPPAPAQKEGASCR